MIRALSVVAAATFASLMVIAPVYAQTPATAPAGTAPAPKSGADMKAARTAASLECSKEADGKSMHGKERKKFMKACKKEAKAKAN